MQFGFNVDIGTPNFKFEMSYLDKFWEIIETKMGCNVPYYIRNILALNGYENAVSICTIEPEDIDYLQEYARKEMHKRIPKDANLQDYYGFYAEKPAEFVFLRGHVKLLQGIVAFIKQEIESKGPDYFSFKSKIQANKLGVRKSLQGELDPELDSFRVITC